MAIQNKAVGLLSALLLGTLAGCATPSRIMADFEVDRLCQKDAGTKVYEKITLPSKYFYYVHEGTPTGRVVNLWLVKQDRASLGLWFEKSYAQKIVQQQAEGPSIFRQEYEIRRLPDGALIAEAIDYIRSGGDAFNPFIPTKYSCLGKDYDYGTAFLQQVFVEAAPK